MCRCRCGHRSAILWHYTQLCEASSLTHLQVITCYTLTATWNFLSNSIYIIQLTESSWPLAQMASPSPISSSINWNTASASTWQQLTVVMVFLFLDSKKAMLLPGPQHLTATAWCTAAAASQAVPMFKWHVQLKQLFLWLGHLHWRVMATQLNVRASQ